MTRVPVSFLCFFFLMIRRPPRSTLSSSSAASDVYKRQIVYCPVPPLQHEPEMIAAAAVSYTHLRAHETPEHLVCRLLLEKKKQTQTRAHINIQRIKIKKKKKNKKIQI